MQAEISDGLKRVIQSEYEGLMIALLDTFGDMGIYVPSSRLFWQDQLLFSENILRILEEGLKYEKNKLFFIALGVTAKALAEEFF